MQDEEMDDMIRDAAKQHYPTYDDKAWGKMEYLLDKQLPQKKDKKRYILFLLLFLLVGTGSFFAIVYSKKNSSSKQVSSVQNKTSENTTTSVTVQNTPTVINNDHNTTKQTASTETKPVVINATTSIQSKNVIAVADIHAKHNKLILKRKTRFRSQSTNADVADNDPNPANDKQISSAKNEVTPDNIPSDESINKSINNSSITKIVVTNSIVNINKDSTSKTATAVLTSKASDKKDEPPFDNKFAFTISVGPGLSYIGLEYVGKTTVSYGAGISYAFTKRFLLRTGFYVSSKIYSANASDYHPPKWFSTYYPDLQKVDANCKVYEIPLNISYEFAQRKNHNWFVATGLSSYLMKRETYGYSYIDALGPQFKNSTIDNQNQHFFSILTFSGGYQYKISNQFSIMGEPYVEVPLNGIGFGKIKLNSSGLLFTAIIKPFAGKK